MKRKWVRKGNKWRRKFSLDIEDWIVIFITVHVIIIALINYFILRG